MDAITLGNYNQTSAFDSNKVQSTTSEFYSNEQANQLSTGQYYVGEQANQLSTGQYYVGEQKIPLHINVDNIVLEIEMIDSVISINVNGTVIKLYVEKDNISKIVDIEETNLNE